jgi:uncharacterized membrane protein
MIMNAASTCSVQHGIASLLDTMMKSLQFQTTGSRVQVCITKGLSYGRAATVMCMQYFSIVISEVAGVLLFREYPNFWGLSGMALVVSSMVAYVYAEAHRKARQGSGSR